MKWVAIVALWAVTTVASHAWAQGERPEMEVEPSESEATSPSADESASANKVASEGEEFVDLMRVTGSRGAPSDLELDRSVSITSQNERRMAHASSVPDWISELPGVYVQKTNRSAGAPIIRGFVGPQNLLLIDGVRLSTSTYRTGPLQYLNITDPHAFTQVEVLRGPGSALYGSDAFGGVVHMRTPQIDLAAPSEATASFDYGSADSSIDVNASANGNIGPLGALVGVGYREFGTLRAGGGKEVPLSSNRHLSARGKLRLPITNAWDVQAAILATAVDDAGRIDRLITGDYRINDNQDYLAYVQTTYRTRTFLERASLTLSYQRLAEHIDRFRCDTNADGTVEDLDACVAASSVVLSRAPATLNRKRVYDDTLDALGGNLSVDLAFLDGDLAFSLGAELYSEEVSSEMQQAVPDDGWVFEERDGNFPDGASFFTTGVYAHGHYVPIRFTEDWQISVNGGGRFTYANTKAKNETLGNVDSGFSGGVGTAGLVLSNTQLMGVYFNCSQGFRAPNLQESVLVGDTGSNFEIANPDLGPERILGLEGGLKINHELGYLRSAYFWNHISDLIARQDATYNGQSTYEGVPVVKRVNAGTAKYDGVEIAAGLRYWNLTLHGHGTWTRGKVKPTDEEGAEEENGRRVPPIFYLAGLRYDAPDEETYVQLFVQGALRKKDLSDGDKGDLRICGNLRTPGTLRDPCNSVRGWTTVNVRMGHKISDALWADLALLNLTDQRYRTLGSGFDFPGIAAKVSLTASY